MKRVMLTILASALMTSLFVPAIRAEDEKVPLDQLPAEVKKAAEGAVKGIVLTEAEKEVKNGVTVYEIDGKADGKEYEIKVSADGKVISAKLDEDDDDDDDKPAAASRKAVPPPVAPKGDF